MKTAKITKITKTEKIAGTVSKLPQAFAAVAVFTAAILFAACSGGTDDSTRPNVSESNQQEQTAITADQTPAGAPEETFTLRTSTKKNCTSTPWVVGEAKGFFEQNGIAIEYTGELNSADELPAVLNGTNDFAGALPNGLATYVAEGAEVKAVTLEQADPPPDVDPKYRHMRFYVSPDLGVTTLEELQTFRDGGNLTVSGRAPTCSSFIPQAIFKNNGLDPNRLELVAFDTDTAAIQAVQQGNLDIAGIHPPFYYLAEQNGLILLADSADAGLGQATGTSVIYFTTDFIEQNPEAVQRLVTALKESAQWILDNPEEATDLTEAYIGSEVNAVHYFYPIKGFPTELLQPWIDSLVEAGALEPGQLTIEDISTDRFQ